MINKTTAYANTQQTGLNDVLNLLKMKQMMQGENQQQDLNQQQNTQQNLQGNSFMELVKSYFNGKGA